jgi:PKD repeat protein
MDWRLFFIILGIVVAASSPVNATVTEYVYGPCQASSVYDAASGCSNAFDHNPSTVWTSTIVAGPWWISSDYGSGNSYTINNYTLLSGSTDGWMSEWQFQGSSNNASAWTLLDKRTGQSVQSTTTIYNSFTETGNISSYRWYRVLFTTKGGGSNYAEYKSIEFFNDASAAAPVASFTSKNISIARNATLAGWIGESPFTMVFNSTSTNTPTAWNYTALNTLNSTEFILGSTANISVTFQNQGNYSVYLNATNAIGFNKTYAGVWVNITGNAPISSFNQNVTTGAVPFDVAFNDTSTGTSITSYNLSFGDGSWLNQTSFPATNITHTYTTAGSYTVTWYVTNSGGTGSSTGTVTAYNPANAQFSMFNTAGTAPFTTYLYDTSTNLTPGPATYYWMLGDGNTSTSQNLYFTWNKTGTYSLNHSVSNGLSTSWLNRSAYVTVGTPTPAVVAPVASFYGGPQIGATPLIVYFTDASANTPTSWNWSFGDSTFGITQNPSHTYNSSGFFTVNLTATNSAGTNTTSQSNFIMVY